MEGKDLAEQIAQMLQDVEALSQRANQTPDQPLEILTNTFEQLHIALEELQVANQELQQQNEQLAAARHILEQERQRYTDLFEFAPDAYASVTDGDRHKTLAAGFQLHLSKPCELTELATAIVTLAGQDHTTAN